MKLTLRRSIKLKIIKLIIYIKKYGLELHEKYAPIIINIFILFINFFINALFGHIFSANFFFLLFNLFYLSNLIIQNLILF